MAVDFWHRLLVIGPHADVRAFQRRIWREYPRTVARKTWTEIVPFSFESLYELAPAARAVAAEPPCDPYDLSVWPLRRAGAGSEVRYQFHTRNLEMQDLLRVLSRACPTLTFTLATLCLDDGDIYAHQLRAGAVKRWGVPRRRFDQLRKRARAKFKVVDGGDNDALNEADDWVEMELFQEALFHWHEDPPRRPLQWWNQMTFRGIDEERDLFMAELMHQDAERRRRRAKRRKGGADRRPARRRSRRTESAGG
jgi:hypothetical protein